MLSSKQTNKQKNYAIMANKLNEDVSNYFYFFYSDLYLLAPILTGTVSLHAYPSSLHVSFVVDFTLNMWLLFHLRLCLLIACLYYQRLKSSRANVPVGMIIRPSFSPAYWKRPWLTAGVGNHGVARRASAITAQTLVCVQPRRLAIRDFN